LAKELKIDRHSLNNELVRQSALYGFWSGLYAIVSAKVAFLEEQVDHMESKLFKHYRIDKHIKKVTDIKYLINGRSEYQTIKTRLRRWKDSERQLKYAERAFSQRKDILMAINANRRQDKKQEQFKEEEE